MADYPDWVLKHKTKGTYINFANGKYYLYAAHSERIPGTKKVRRVSDGYIGRITQDAGLIPTRDKVSGDIIVYKYGLHMTAFALSGQILLGLQREFRGAAKNILVMGILLATGNAADESAFNASYLSLAIPDAKFIKKLTDKQRTGLERCSRMVTDKLSAVASGDADILTKLDRVYMVVVNNKEYISKKSADVDEWLNGHGIVWGVRI